MLEGRRALPAEMKETYQNWIRPWLELYDSRFLSRNLYSEIYLSDRLISDISFRSGMPVAR